MTDLGEPGPSRLNGSNRQGQWRLAKAQKNLKHRRPLFPLFAGGLCAWDTRAIPLLEGPVAPWPGPADSTGR